MQVISAGKRNNLFAVNYKISWVQTQLTHILSKMNGLSVILTNLSFLINLYEYCVGGVIENIVGYLSRVWVADLSE